MWKYLLIVVGFIASAGAGFYFGEDHVVRMNVAEIASAQSKGASEQAKKDATDYAKGRASTIVRAGDKTKSDASLKAIVDNKGILVPAQKECVVSAPAMRKLNDPDLVGKDAQ